MASIDIRSMTIEEIEQLMHEYGQPRYRAKQIFSWLHSGTASFDEMSDIPKGLRSLLKENCYIADVDIEKLLEYHKQHGKLATISGVKPESRFGILDLSHDNQVMSFREKSNVDTGFINAGFMVLDPKVLDYVEDDTVMFEGKPMEKLAEDGQLMCYKHDGFWQCMDTMRDKEKLERLWADGTAPWRVWKD